MQRAFNADAFNLVVGVTDACRVDQIDGQAVQMNRVRNAVSGGARNVCDDGDIVAGQSIHQRALADIGRSGENNREALAKHFAAHGCVLQLHELLRDRGHAFIDVTAFNKVDFLFRKINGRFDVGTQFQKIRVDVVNAFGKLSLQGASGGTHSRA